MAKKQIGNETRVNRYGYLFVFPFVLVYTLFSLYPTFYTFMIAFTDLKGLKNTLISSVLRTSPSSSRTSTSGVR